MRINEMNYQRFSVQLCSAVADAPHDVSIIDRSNRPNVLSVPRTMPQLRCNFTLLQPNQTELPGRRFGGNQFVLAPTAVTLRCWRQRKR
jgi:hypothetical protein